MKIQKIQSLLHPFTGTITIPGSKSYTNRALILAALTAQSVRIKNPLFSDDTQAMIACLKTLGIKIRVSKNMIEVIGSINDVKEKTYDLDADLSGTTIRFLTALATIIPGVKIIHGKEGLQKRPIADLVEGLKQLGAKIEYLEKEGFPPIRVTSSTLQSKSITLNGAMSSQFLSAILMIAPIINGLTVSITGEQTSKPYIAMTIAIMKEFGVKVNNKIDKQYMIAGEQQYKTSEYLVEGDFSSAGYFFAIAALTKSTLTLNNLPAHSQQADKRLLTVLETMGNQIVYGQNNITIVGKGIKAMTINMTDFPDQAQTLAVLAAFVDGKTKLTGIQSLRVKETERVIALQNELKKMGINTIATHDSLTIIGGNPKPAIIDTYDDHRMAMAFAVAKTKLPEISINNSEVVSKTFPDFWKILSDLTHNKKTNIILIGMRGSGKTTIGKMLAQTLQKDFFDLDTMLAKKLGKNLRKIIKEHGWEYFRKEEAKIAQATKQINNAVIATGGGVVLKKENIAALKQHGKIIFLHANSSILAKRIGEDADRPALTNKQTIEEEMREVLNQRELLYKNAADIIINTETPKAKQVIERIVAMI